MVPTIVEQHRAASVDDTPAALFGSFADRDLVGSAAASLPASALGSDTRDRAQWLRGVERNRRSYWLGVGLAEGPQHMIEVSPGTIRFRRRDLVRDEQRAAGTLGRTARNAENHARDLERISSQDAQVAASAGYRLENGEPERKGRAKIATWSTKSRANMAYTLNALDYSPLIGSGALAMVTLTYPGDWLAVAPASSVCQAHLRNLRKRFARAWGRPMIGVWKREFQRRGAPHFHILMVPPAGRVNGQTFPEWLSSTWAAVVDHPDVVERMNHEAAGTNVDLREGSRYTDPRRVGAYFSKHGLFSAKDYQNEAPAAWQDNDDEGIGRFWGTWGLRKAVIGREVAPSVYDDLRRTVRRYQAATHLRGPQGAPAVVKRQVWRKVTTVDKSTGEIGWKWRRRNVNTRMKPRLSGRAGFLAVNDGPGFALQVSRQATGEGRSSFVAWSRSQTETGA